MSRLCRLGVLPQLGLNELWWRIHNEGGRRDGALCAAMPRNRERKKTEEVGNVNKIEWWMVVFDIVGSVSAREGWVGKSGESMRQTE